MTREEAITDIRDNIKPVVGGKSLDMAIKALEQEPCEDCISRVQAIEEADKLCLETGYDNEKVEEMLKDLPSVTPQPRTGHWIEHPEIETSTPEYLMFYECSECGDKQCFCKSDIHKKHFCNNCGAKMREVEE